MKSIKREDCIFAVERLAEDTPIRGNIIDSGDNAFDKEVEDTVSADLKAGNKWAWCTAKVTCRHSISGIIGTAYLGCCNYKSESDFKQQAYYSDMCNDAFEECVEEYEKLKKEYKRLQKIFD